MTKPHLKLVPPIAENQTVSSRPWLRRLPNSAYRSREYLTEPEVERLIEAVKGNRWGHRDATMILMAFRHGFRVSELVTLKWDQVDFTGGNLHVRRIKKGTPSTHPLSGRELRALRRLRRETEPVGPFVFMTERKTPFSVSAFQKLVERSGRAAGFEFSIHCHMLRHATGYALANAGQDLQALQRYLGHRNVQHTIRYAELAPGRFKNFWKD